MVLRVTPSFSAAGNITPAHWRRTSITRLTVNFSGLPPSPGLRPLRRLMLLAETLPPHAKSLQRVNGTQAAVPMNCPTMDTSIRPNGNETEAAGAQFSHKLGCGACTKCPDTHPKRASLGSNSIRALRIQQRAQRKRAL